MGRKASDSKLKCSAKNRRKAKFARVNCFCNLSNLWKALLNVFCQSFHTCFVLNKNGQNRINERRWASYLESIKLFSKVTKYLFSPQVLDTKKFMALTILPHITGITFQSTFRFSCFIRQYLKKVATTKQQTSAAAIFWTVQCCTDNDRFLFRPNVIQLTSKWTDHGEKHSVCRLLLLWKIPVNHKKQPAS